MWPSVKSDCCLKAGQIHKWVTEVPYCPLINMQNSFFCSRHINVSSTVCEELFLAVSRSLYSQISPAQIKCDLTRGPRQSRPFLGTWRETTVLMSFIMFTSVGLVPQRWLYWLYRTENNSFDRGSYVKVLIWLRMGVFTGLSPSESYGTSYFQGKCDSWALLKGIHNRSVFFMSVGPMLFHKWLMLTFSSSASEMTVSCIFYD